jgi:hypothetical protein
VLRYEEILRCKRELGYNIVGVGAEAYISDGFAAVFEKAIEPYLVDYGSTSTTLITAATTPTAVAVTLASNPAITGLTNQTATFVVGTQVVVDVGPLQETGVVILGLSGLVATMQLQLAHGSAGAYPVLLQGAEQGVRDIFARLDAIANQMTGVAPLTAGIKQVDEVQIHGAEKGRRGMRNKIDDLSFQRDLARKDLAAALGVPNLWEIRGKNGGGGAANLSYEPM